MIGAERGMAAMLPALLVALSAGASGADGFPKPYSAPCVERENVFAFIEKPAVKKTGEDKYEITFAVKGNCDATVGIVDDDGKVIRHLASGVLGSNAPGPFQKNTLKQTLYWNGKDDLDAYYKTPEKLRVRVMLGLKPEFDRRLGGTSPKNLPGNVWGLAIDQGGAYVFVKGWHLTLRKFDLDGNYAGTLFPPPANTPPERLAGTGFIEYEPGRRAWHGPDVHQSFADNGMVFPFPVDYKSTFQCQVAAAGNRLVFLNGGTSLDSAIAGSTLFYLRTDGSTDLNGMRGAPFAWGAHRAPQLAASPDGKWVYMVCSGGGKYIFDPVVVRGPADGSARATVFAGERGRVGSDNAHLNAPTGIDCDAAGRVYVADSANNRVQVFAPDGAYLKTLPFDRPRMVRVHQRTGGIYVQHSERIQGQTIPRLTKVTSFDQPVEEFHADNVGSAVMAVDSWSASPRVWLAGDVDGKSGAGLVIYEEQNRALKKIADFDEEARRDAGDDYMGRWGGDNYGKVVCDPVRGQAYYRNAHVIDITTGKRLGTFRINASAFDDIAFDKRGFMHVHFNPCFFMQGVGRVDPSQGRRDGSAKRGDAMFYPEVPYDFGEQKTGPWGMSWVGIIPVKDQNGAKGFQDGLGVNMRGDLAVESNIYHVPRMEEEGWAFAAQAITESRKRGEYVDGSRGRDYNSVEAYTRMIQDKEKRGEEVYSIRRQPGIPLAGATIWTYDRYGELRAECAVPVGRLLANVQIDDDGFLYFANNRPKHYDGKSFLAGCGGVTGAPAAKSNPFTSALIKTRGKAKVIMEKAAIPLDPRPSRPPDIVDTGGFPLDGDGSGGTKCWVEDAEWVYAGTGSMVAGGCSCPSSRFHLDWYKRVFVPEAYRHSIGILDTNGNLIMHLGRYGNFDDAPGGRDGAKPGGEDVGMMLVRFISGTDSHLVFDDWGEKIVVMKLSYQAEETASVR